SFCVCVEGTSGDRCETIDQCKEVDCGQDPSATGSNTLNDGAYCRCNKAYQVFDEKEKVCKAEILTTRLRGETVLRVTSSSLEKRLEKNIRLEHNRRRGENVRRGENPS
ncbi:hypothetical protein AVEN_266154-1, partial [Araneus ventricosus]